MTIEQLNQEIVDDVLSYIEKSNQVSVNMIADELFLDIILVRAAIKQLTDDGKINYSSKELPMPTKTVPALNSKSTLNTNSRFNTVTSTSTSISTAISIPPPIRLFEVNVPDRIKEKIATQRNKSLKQQLKSQKRLNDSKLRHAKRLEDRTFTVTTSNEQYLDN